MEVINGVKSDNIENNKVIPAEGETYGETKSTLLGFDSNEPSSGLWGMIFGFFGFFA